MTKFDPNKDSSQIIGHAVRKWVQDGVYFDRNFEPVDKRMEEKLPKIPPVPKPDEKLKAKPIPRPEVPSRVVGKVDDAE